MKSRGGSSRSLKIIFVLFDRRIDWKAGGMFGLGSAGGGGGFGLSTHRDSDVIFSQARSQPEGE